MDVHRICVVGTGYVGLPLATLLSRQFEVVGFDSDRRKISELQAGRATIQEPGLQAAMDTARRLGRLKFTFEPLNTASSDVKILTVGTPFDIDSQSVDFTQLDSALSLVVPQLKPGDVVIAKSTVPPGTTSGRIRRSVEASGLKVPADVGLVYSPERIVEGQALADFQSLPKIIGASDERSYRAAHEVLSTLGGSVMRVSNPETAELVKMVDNYARYVFLGLTNEIALISELVGVDVLELIEAAKFEYPRNSGILTPGPGVGGSCLNKDPFVLAALAGHRGLELEMVEAAAVVNRGIPSHIAQLVHRFSGSRRKVVVCGLAFKRDTDDTRFSSSFEIAAALRDMGYSVTLTDPYVRSGPSPIQPSLTSAATGAQILLLLADHSDYRQVGLMDLKKVMLPDPLLIDTRGLYNRLEAERTGFEYHGLGRI